MSNNKIMSQLVGESLKMPYLSYNNSKIYYEINGEGFPLLYLHGWNGSTKSFRECLSEELAKDSLVIMLDLPGFGKSGYFPLSFAAVSEIVNQVLIRHHIESVRIMGFCMGGAFALDFTIRYPQRVKSMILLETSFQFPWIMSPILIPAVGKHILQFFLLHPLGIHLTKKYLLLSDYQYRKDFFVQFQNVDPNISYAYARLLYKYSKIGHHRRIGGIQSNTKIIIGEHTSKAISSSAKRLAQLLRNSEISILENARHFPIEENSAGLIHRLRTFLRQNYLPEPVQPSTEYRVQ